MKKKTPAPFILHVFKSKDGFRKESLVLLEKTVEDEAIRLAKILAEETGRCVTVRDGEFILIKTIPAAKLH
jgi:hypothetical protein